jgi:signal transduction histidine kinase
VTGAQFTYRDPVLSSPTAGEARQGWLRMAQDLAVPAGLAVVGTLQLLTAPTGEDRAADVWAGLLVAGMTLPLVWRRRWPLAVTAVSAIPWIAFLIADYPPGPVALAPLVGLFHVGLRGDRARTVTVGAIVEVIVIMAVTVDGWSLLNEQTPLFAAAFALPLAMGDALASRRAYVAELVHRAEEAERTREAEAERRVEQERLRIARDLHDVVAHTISTINVQAGVAAHLMTKDPQEARAALVAIKDASREALVELRGLLRVLRPSDVPLRPTAGLDNIDRLLTDVSHAGLDVRLETSGVRPAGLDDMVQLAVYRIAQEACTNVLRHAGGAPTSMRITYRPSDLELSVRNAPPNGHARSRPLEPGAGVGVAGMRERATMVGGHLHIGPTKDGGFEVRAEIPYRAPT